MQHLVEDRRTLLRDAARLRPTGRYRLRIEERLAVPPAAGDEPRNLRWDVQIGHLFLDVNRKTLGQDGAEHRRPDGSADLAPELDLARRHPEEVPRYCGLHGREVERKGCSQPGANEHDVADDFEARRRDGDLR